MSRTRRVPQPPSPRKPPPCLLLCNFASCPASRPVWGSRLHATVLSISISNCHHAPAYITIQQPLTSLLAVQHADKYAFALNPDSGLRYRLLIETLQAALHCCLHGLIPAARPLTSILTLAAVGCGNIYVIACSFGDIDGKIYVALMLCASGVLSMAQQCSNGGVKTLVPWSGKKR